MSIDEKLIEPGKQFAAGVQVREVLEIVTEMVASGDEMRRVTRVCYTERGNRKETWADLTIFAQAVDREVQAGDVERS